MYAAEIAVRREGQNFRISGPAKPADIALYVGGSDVPPVFGTVTADGPDLLFRPRFEIPPTVACRVVVNGQVFPFPAQQSEPTAPSTRVEQVYPTVSEIPANQLKFYLQFSAPMRPGNAWQHLRLLDAQGRPVELAFLEIDQELWDRDGLRLTVLFDPGRIKRGVLPLAENGPALVAGQRYTLVADAAWRDERGVPLAAEFRKAFTILPEDRTAIDPSKWKLSLPKAATREPLIIQFGESLDAALALRLINIPLAPGQPSLGPAEREWRYVPDQPWNPGTYFVSIDRALEDLAGNKVGRLFDVDTFERISTKPSRETVLLPFHVH